MYFSFITSRSSKSILNVEQNKDPLKGNRYLVELQLATKSGTAVRFSEYVYQPKRSSKLCYPKDFKWNKKADVNLILTSGNQARWTKYFIDSMSTLYQRTKDKNFNVIIFDFNTQNGSLVDYLENSNLPRYTLIMNRGLFHKTQAIQTAANTILDPNAITMQVDLHTTIPLNFIEYVRKVGLFIENSFFGYSV